MKYGRLKIITESGRKYHFFCLCDCGNQKVVNIYKLKSGHTKSCGCLHREFLARDRGGRNLETKPCFYCKENFSAYASRNQIYCSLSCKARDQLPGINKGRPAWNKGLLGFRAGEKRDYMPEGEKHWSWKGDKVQYRALHQWVVNNLGQPDTCENCGKKGTGHNMHWANKSRLYKRKLTDWVRLCPKCHGAYDRNQLVLSF